MQNEVDKDIVNNGDKLIDVQFVLDVDIALLAARRDDECHIANLDLLLCSCSVKCGGPGD